MEKVCLFCKHWDDKGNGLVGDCRELARTIEVKAPLRVSDAFSCSHWATREPAEYRPGDGPFYAKDSYDNSGWYVFCSSGEALYKWGARTVREHVDMLNRACREWAEENALVAAQEAAASELRRVVDEAWRRETEAALENARRYFQTKKSDDRPS